MSTIPTPESDRTLTVEFLFGTEGAAIAANEWLSKDHSFYEYALNKFLGLKEMSHNVHQEYKWDRGSPYPRQQIISEEWTTDVNSPAFVIDKYDRIFDHSKDGWGFQFYEHPIALAPTKEFIEEILLIRQGKWIPLKGDECYIVNRNTFNFSNIARIFNGKPKHIEMLDLYAHFPSIKQRDEWMSKNKPINTPTPPQIAQDEQTQPSPYSDESASKNALRVATISYNGATGSIGVQVLAKMVAMIIDKEKGAQGIEG